MLENHCDTLKKSWILFVARWLTKFSIGSFYDVVLALHTDKLLVGEFGLNNGKYYLKGNVFIIIAFSNTMFPLQWLTAEHDSETSKSDLTINERKWQRL